MNLLNVLRGFVGLGSNYQFSFKRFSNYALVRNISPKWSGLFWGL